MFDFVRASGFFQTIAYYEVERHELRLSCFGSWLCIPSEDEVLNFLEMFTGLIVLVSGATNEIINAGNPDVDSPKPETVVRTTVASKTIEKVETVSPEVNENVTAENPDLDPAEHVDRVAALISSNEGEPDRVCWNDNGHGVSVGMFQANQEKGELPELLKAYSERPEGHRTLLNAFGKEMTARIENDPEIIRNLKFKPNNWLGKGLQFLAKKDSFAELQIDWLRDKVKSSSEFAAEHGITSTLGVAIVADLTNQWGRGGAARFIKAVGDKPDEATKVKSIVNVVENSSIYGDRYRGDLEKAPELGLSLHEEFELNS